MMNNERQEINQEDIIRSIAYATGFTQKDIRKILRVEEEVIATALTQGLSVKNHKLYKLALEDKESYTGYDGLNKKYYTVEGKKVLKFKPLVMLDDSMEELNKEEK